MKTSTTLLALLVLLASRALAQEIDTVRLKVASFKELPDCYILSTLRYNKPDTVYLISVKEKLESNGYEQMRIGKVYSFVYKNLLAQAAAMPLSSFAIRIKNTIVWRGGESTGKIPFLALNTKNLYIKEINK